MHQCVGVTLCPVCASRSLCGRSSGSSWRTTGLNDTPRNRGVEGEREEKHETNHTHPQLAGYTPAIHIPNWPGTHQPYTSSISRVHTNYTHP